VLFGLRAPDDYRDAGLRRRPSPAREDPDARRCCASTGHGSDRTLVSLATFVISPDDRLYTGVGHERAGHSREQFLIQLVGVATFACRSGVGAV
jgi:hypothetical protein